MQKFASNEGHDAKVNRADPNWLSVYGYITALLREEELPVLGQIGEFPSPG